MNFHRNWPYGHLYPQTVRMMVKQEKKEPQNHGFILLHNLVDSCGCKSSKTTIKRHFYNNKLFGSVARKKSISSESIS